jgi:UDP-N-acetylglucosamine acyltransferase
LNGAPGIHPSALVDPDARLGEGVSVGAYAVVEAGVTVGDGCVLGHHSVLHTGVGLGRRNKVHPHAVLGGDPQDLKYAGQPTLLQVGDDNSFREFTTVNRGTVEGGGVTRIGSHNLLMAYVHVAHDCQVGDHVVFANCATLAGHVEVGDHTVIGGLAACHQHCRVGTGAMVGGMARISKDVPPYSTTSGTDDVKVYGLNKLGLKRRGLSRPDLEALENAYRIYQDSQLNISQALAKLVALEPKTREMELLVAFLKGSQRGVYR